MTECYIIVRIKENISIFSQTKNYYSLIQREKRSAIYTKKLNKAKGNNKIKIRQCGR